MAFPKEQNAWCAKVQMCPNKTSCCVDQFCSTCAKRDIAKYWRLDGSQLSGKCQNMCGGEICKILLFFRPLTPNLPTPRKNPAGAHGSCILRFADVLMNEWKCSDLKCIRTAVEQSKIVRWPKSPCNQSCSTGKVYGGKDLLKYFSPL